MKKYKIILLVTILLDLLFLNGVVSQEIDPKTTTCITEKAREFLIEIDQFNKEKNQIGAILVEIKDKTSIGYAKNGVYFLTTTTSHTKKYLVLKKDTQFKIITFKNLTKSLLSIVSFLEEINATDKEIVEYMERLSFILNRNRKSIYNPKITEDSEWMICK